MGSWISASAAEDGDRMALTESTKGSVLDLVPGRRGHYAFESGYHGDLWLDLDALFARPGILRPHAAALADLVRPAHPDVVCGPLLGGAYAAQLVAESLDAAFAWSTPPSYTVTGDVSGRRVAIVDDAINAGSAVSATADTLAAAGGTVVAVAAFLALGDAPARLAGVPVDHLATVPSHLWPPPTCPLCGAGSPLDDPPT
jgi:orotate phosphoribosyltransferase